jgi:hypothetical protein
MTNLTKRWWAVTVVAALLTGTAAYKVTAAPDGPRSLRHFDPDRLSNLELRMWKAYYAKQRLRLFALLVTMLREQYHYSWATAVTEGFYLARAASTFGDATANYEVVLPDLERAYETANNWLQAGFDPRQVARAELAWWVARRTPGHNDPTHVGLLIAEEYSLLYQAPVADMVRAGTLRAQAAALRDSQAEHPDWPAIEQALRDSYRELSASLSKKTASFFWTTELDSCDDRAAAAT